MNNPSSLIKKAHPNRDALFASFQSFSHICRRGGENTLDNNILDDTLIMSFRTK